MFKSDAKLSVSKKLKISAANLSKRKLEPLQKIIDSNNIRLNRVFRKRFDEQELPSRAKEIYRQLNFDPTSFFTVSGVSNPERIQAQMLEQDLVEAAYIKPPGEDPGLADQVTPDFSTNQGYLDTAPRGVDAKFAWRMSGGRGEGVDVIDMEQGFNLTHEDLPSHFSGLIQGNNRESSRNHGTAVLGVIGGDDNGRGVTGIAHNAQLRAISYNGSSTSQTIIDAADELNAGDILLLEVHRIGPASDYIAIEWWPDDFAATVYATSKGIIVVEAAGNGSEDFDAEIYNQPQSGFPSSWKNPFNMNNPQSGAIIVGAGSPSSSSDRTILGFSNWGSRVDAQGWGNSVCTTGYGGLQGDLFTTIDPFNGWQADPGFPKPLGSDIGFISTLGSGVDAALWSDTNQKVYFFKDDKYVRMDAVSHNVDPDYPKEITGNWPGFPSSFESGVDAALWAEKIDKIYFFRGSEYIRVDPNNNWNVDPGYPKPIAGNWPGLPANFTSGIDTAIWTDKNDKVYLFRGNQYVRLDPFNSWNVDPGYPKSIAGNWVGFTNAYTTGVTAGYYSKTDRKAYFSKKEENYWYTGGFNGTSSASPVVTGALACIQSRLKARGKSMLTPSTAQNILRTTGSPQLRFSGDPEQDSPSNWRAVNASFGSGIDAALWNGKSDRIYFFRGSQYLRIDPNTNWNVEPEYPKPIEDNWPGFPSDFENGVDAAIWSEPNQKVYFFKGSEYIRVDPFNGWNVDSGYPKPIAGNWPGFPSDFASGVDAAIWNDKNQKIYFFRDDEYIRVDPANSWNTDPGYPKPITGNWPGMDTDFTDDLDAVVWSGTNDKIYFFKGEDYVRVDPFNGWNMDAGYPKIIARQRIGNRPDLREAFADLDIDSNWPGFPSHFGQNLEASLWSDKNDKIYFFKGSEYIRVDPFNNWETDPGYPKPISGNWPGFPSGFASGVDAGLWSEKNSKIYFFKGSEYIRVDPDNAWNVDPGYPKPISGNWPGFPSHFTTGVDAALWSEKNGKIYFFKDSQYIRVDPNNAWNVDPGYPKPISGNWPGLSAPFTNDLDCTLWNDKSDKVYFFSGDEYVRIDPDNGWKAESGYPKPIIS